MDTTMTEDWEALMRVDDALSMIDDTIDEVEAPALDLAARLDGIERIAIRVDEPAFCPKNELPVLEARLLVQPSVSDVIEIARDAYLTCLAANDGRSTNGNCDCEPSTLDFARSAEARLRAKEEAGLIAIDRFDPTANVYASYAGWWEGNRPVLEDGLLTMTPAIGS